MTLVSHWSTAKIERGLGTERARLGTFRAGPRGLSTQSSLKCLFVCLFVCLFIFPHKCTIGDKSLQISKQYPLHEQKLLVPPACVHNQNSKVCLFVCLSVLLKDESPFCNRPFNLMNNSPWIYSDQNLSSKKRIPSNFLFLLHLLFSMDFPVKSKTQSTKKKLGGL